MTTLDEARLESLKDVLISLGNEEEDVIEAIDTYEEDTLQFIADNDLALEDADELEALLKTLDSDIILAGIACDVSLDNIEEAYAGNFRDDEDFAQDFADQLGLIDTNASWPTNCIDWEHAAKELMYDYSEDNGYYFRNF